MLQITPQMKIFVAIEPVDFRNGIDGLVALCKKKLEADPFSGALFVFRSRRKIAVKVLAYDGQGFWVAQKRLSSGHFRHWPQSDQVAVKMVAHELMLLLWNGNPKAGEVAAAWKKISG